MTNRFYLALVALFLGLQAQAQITYTNASFPIAGDVLKTSTVDTSFGVQAVSSTALTWDFSGLESDFYREDTVLNASTGAAFTQFPNTELLLPFFAAFGGESYVDVTTTAMTREGAAISLFGRLLTAQFSDPQTVQEATLTMGSTFTDNYALSFKDHIDSIPFLRQVIDNLVAGQLPTGTTADSIRINMTGSVDAAVDAFGSCQMHNGTYNVLRQKVTEITDIKVDVYVNSFIGGFWLDVTSTVGNAGVLPFELNDTTTRYDFLAEGEKQPIVRLNMDSTGLIVDNVEYMGLPVVSSATALESTEMTYVVYPNPVSSVLTVSGEAVEAATAVEVYNMMGQMVYRKANPAKATMQINVEALPAGNYILSIQSGGARKAQIFEVK